MRIHLPLIAAAWTFLAAICSSTQADTTRESMPWTLSVAANAILPSVGGDLSLALSDRFAVGMQATQLLVAHVDLSLRLRIFLIAGETSGLYLGANGHLWYSPLILERVSPVATAELGYELRRKSGFTLGFGLGAGALFERRDEAVHANRTEPIVMLNARLGKSWGQ